MSDEKSAAEGVEGPGADGASDRPHQVLVEMQIVQRAQAGTEDLVALMKVPQVRPAVITTRIAGAAPVYWIRVARIAGIADLEHTVAREQLAVARIARGQHAVEHVDALRHRNDDILRRSHTHQIAGLLPRHARRNVAQHALHRLLGLAYR